MCLTNRAGGIDIMWGNMKRQSIQDFELVLVDGRWRERENEVKEYINDPRLKYIRQTDKLERAYTNLAHADNLGFSNCSGDLIVSIQDFIWCPPDLLEKYLYAYKTYGDCLVTAVGNQYSNPFPVNDNGKITVFEKPYTRRPEQLCWTDPRINFTRPSFSEAQPVEWELSCASIPKKVIEEVGGMDEQFDFEGFAWDNTYIAAKAALLGYKIYLDQTNEYLAFNHDGWWPNPLKVNRVSPKDYFFKKLGEIQSGIKPIKDNDLSNYPKL